MCDYFLVKHANRQEAIDRDDDRWHRIPSFSRNQLEIRNYKFILRQPSFSINNEFILLIASKQVLRILFWWVIISESSELNWNYCIYKCMLYVRCACISYVLLYLNIYVLFAKIIIEGESNSEQLVNSIEGGVWDTFACSLVVVTD